MVLYTFTRGSRPWLLTTAALRLKRRLQMHKHLRPRLSHLASFRAIGKVAATIAAARSFALRAGTASSLNLPRNAGFGAARTGRIKRLQMWQRRPPGGRFAAQFFAGKLPCLALEI